MRGRRLTLSPQVLELRASLGGPRQKPPLLEDGDLERPCLQPRELHQMRRVKPFRKDDPVPQPGRIFRNVGVRGETPDSALDTRRHVARCDEALDDGGERGGVVGGGEGV